MPRAAPTSSRSRSTRRGETEAAATCAQSFLSTFSRVFDAPTVQEGVEAAVAELKTLQPQCAPALGESA